jgi:hypothetical protein
VDDEEEWNTVPSSPSTNADEGADDDDTSPAIEEMDDGGFNEDFNEINAVEEDDPSYAASPDITAMDDVVFDGEYNDVSDDEVCSCLCQEPPSALPPHFTPCCLPCGVTLAKREIQMFPEFRDNLLGKKGTPRKTQTMRVWGKLRMREHYQNFVHNKWIRVWRGQGNKDTIGWMLITDWDEVKVADITKGDCAREGVPTCTPSMFKKKYLKGLAPMDKLTRLQFTFRGCGACV